VTETQLLLFKEFQRLPIYDESDARAAAVATPQGAGYPRIRECSTLQEVQDSLKDSRLIPLGALRAGADGNKVVVAYFGERN
jgi:hypothetical protein